MTSFNCVGSLRYAISVYNIFQVYGDENLTRPSPHHSSPHFCCCYTHFEFVPPSVKFLLVLLFLVFCSTKHEYLIAKKTLVRRSPLRNRGIRYPTLTKPADDCEYDVCQLQQTATLLARAAANVDVDVYVYVAVVDFVVFAR